MNLLANYSYYCITEKTFVKDTAPLLDPPPLACKNDRKHIIDISSIKKIAISQVPSNPNTGNNKLKNNFDAKTDPSMKNDISEGYDYGSVWYNRKTFKLYTCISGAKNKAIWIISNATKDIDSTNKILPIDVLNVSPIPLRDVMLKAENVSVLNYMVSFMCDIELISGNNREITFVFYINDKQILASKKKYKLNQTNNNYDNVTILFNCNLNNGDVIKPYANVNGGLVRLTNINFSIMGF